MTEPTTPTAIPESVIAALAAVREAGPVNMLDRNGVVYYATQFEQAPEAIIWLHEATPAQYMAALNAMGARRSRNG
jgi:hypothetical protein